MSEPRRQDNVIAFPIDRARLATLRDLITGYESYLRGEGRRDQGIARYVWAIGRFEVWLSERAGHPATLADINPDAIRAYKATLGEAGRKGATIINALATIKDFCSFAQIPDPTAGIRRPPKRRPDPRPLYEEDIFALMQVLRAIPDELPEYNRWIWQRNQRLVALFLYAGLRLTEATNLRWANVKLGSAVIEVIDGKNGRDRVVPIAAALREYLEAVPEAERKPDMAVISKRLPDESLAPMSRRGTEKIIYHWLRRLLDVALADEAMHVYAHRLRTTFASLLLWSEVNIKVIQELLGHADLATTQYYLRVKDNQKKTAVDKLPNF
ncbi:MAG TPA: tyrosine-type recombinase/integrase [Roseiflexaceae bacterium]|nr:tyrosine-type recombinase/integrase [Roseiflexaceae bacterium]